MRGSWGGKAASWAVGPACHGGQHGASSRHHVGPSGPVWPLEPVVVLTWPQQPPMGQASSLQEERQGGRGSHAGGHGDREQ